MNLCDAIKMGRQYNRGIKNTYMPKNCGLSLGLDSQLVWYGRNSLNKIVFKPNLSDYIDENWSIDYGHLWEVEFPNAVGDAAREVARAISEAGSKVEAMPNPDDTLDCSAEEMRCVALIANRNPDYTAWAYIKGNERFKNVIADIRLLAKLGKFRYQTKEISDENIASIMAGALRYLGYHTESFREGNTVWLTAEWKPTDKETT